MTLIRYGTMLVVGATALLCAGCDGGPSQSAAQKASQNAPAPEAAGRTAAAEAASQPPAPTVPGTITVKAGTGPAQKRAGDEFRTYDVKGQSRIRYAPEGAEVTEAVKNVQVVVAARNTNPYASVYASLLSKRLSKDFIVLCSACHDDYGNGVIGPSLIGKSAEDVRRMIDEYAHDPDANVLMADLVKRMSRDQVEFIAQDIARFNAEIAMEKEQAAARDANSGQQGQQGQQGGDSAAKDKP